MTSVSANVVSHTFSIPSLRINVPIPAMSTATFTIRIAKRGAYGWMCFDPCGSGETGFGAPMDLTGYMAGTVTATTT
jgi:heme/copper-type cytochrome/quinol oxidase subunit 2